MWFSGQHAPPGTLDQYERCRSRDLGKFDVLCGQSVQTGIHAVEKYGRNIPCFRATDPISWNAGVDGRG